MYKTQREKKIEKEEEREGERNSTFGSVHELCGGHLGAGSGLVGEPRHNEALSSYTNKILISI